VAAKLGRISVHVYCVLCMGCMVYL
jgi:hypothetical protein